MNKEIEKYINDEVEKFRNELTSKVDAMLEKENEPKTVWDIEFGNKYYFIQPEGLIVWNKFNKDCFDLNARSIGNMFLTREEARFELERRKIETIMKKYNRPFEYEKNNWGIYYGHFDKAVVITCWHNVDYGNYYFESKEVVQKMIDEVGKEKLKKYWLRVEE